MVTTSKRRRVFGPLFYMTAAVATVGLMWRAAISFEEGAREARETAEVLLVLRSGHQPHQTAMQSLRSWPVEKALPILMAEARNPKGEWRAVACRELGTMGADLEELVPVLLDAGTDARDGVRAAAIWSLQNLLARSGGNAGARVAMSAGRLEPWREKASSFFVRVLREDRMDYVREAAVTALAECGAGGALTDVFEEATHDQGRTVKTAAAFALIKVQGGDDPVTIRDLVQMVADPDAVPDRQPIFEKILRDRHERLLDESIKALAAMLPTCEPGVLIEVLGCLEMAGPRAIVAVPALERVVRESDDPTVRGRAVMAIAEIVEPRRLNGSNAWFVAEHDYGSRPEPSPNDVEWDVNARPYAAHVATMLGDVLTDEAMGFEWREQAIVRLYDANPQELSRAAGALTQQLRSEDLRVRVRALNLLAMIVGRVPAALPEPGGSR